MSKSKVSAVFTDEAKDRALSATAEIKSSMDFLISLSKEERSRLTKMGSKSIDFVSRCLEGARQHGNLIPASIDINELARNLDIVNRLRPVQMAVGSLNELIIDTLAAAGSDVMTAANGIYRCMQAGSKGDAAVKAVADKIGERYDKQGPGKKGKDEE